jgi:hypothetical protein
MAFRRHPRLAFCFKHQGEQRRMFDSESDLGEGDLRQSRFEIRAAGFRRPAHDRVQSFETHEG